MQKRQLQAHRELADYVDASWTQAKEAGLDRPAILPEYQSVAAMRDLTAGPQDEAVHASAQDDH